MDIDLIFKIAAVGIIVTVLNLLLTRSGRDEQALMVTIAGLITVLLLLVREISAFFDLVRLVYDASLRAWNFMIVHPAEALVEERLPIRTPLLIRGIVLDILIIIFAVQVFRKTFHRFYPLSCQRKPMIFLDDGR